MLRYYKFHYIQSYFQAYFIVTFSSLFGRSNVKGDVLRTFFLGDGKNFHLKSIHIVKFITHELKKMSS